MFQTGTIEMATGATFHRSCGSPIKRATDVAVAAIALLLLLPMLSFLALAIRLESRGPVLFRQSRGGLKGAPFTIYKFRTMRVLENGDDVQQARRGDARITRVGAVLRKLSFDELPQLLNVLLGEMSLVGPRPHALSHDAQYSSLVSDYAGRFEVKPGLTGLAQISGHRGATPDVQAMRLRVEHDLEYIKNWSTLLDYRILVLTLVKVPFDSRAF